jgi:hypothetical protein
MFSCFLFFSDFWIFSIFIYFYFNYLFLALPEKASPSPLSPSPSPRLVHGRRSHRRLHRRQEPAATAVQQHAVVRPSTVTGPAAQHPDVSPLLFVSKPML